MNININKMKVGVTGHTSGIGKAIYSRYHSNAFGFSRFNGYDIGKDKWKIIQDSKHCDVFINNAQDGFAQTELLYALSKNFKGKIINIGSTAKDWTNGFKKNYKYSVEKVTLNTANDQLFWAGVDTCVINPGHVDTPMIRKFDTKKINPEYVVDVIEWIILQPYRVKEISVCP